MWLVLGVVVLEQPITRIEISARRLADSDRQVQLLLRRLWLGSVGELQERILAQAPEPDTTAAS